MRILVVDDERPVLELLTQICHRDSHDVTPAGTAAEALGLLRANPYDALITDIVMPGVDGLMLIRRAKVIQPDILPLAMTGYRGQYSLEDVIQAGAFDLILKPFRAPELRLRLKMAGEHQKTINKLRAHGRALQTGSSEAIAGLQREPQTAREHAARLAALRSRTDRTGN